MAQQAIGGVGGGQRCDRSVVAEGDFDIASPAFASHLGALLAATRRRDDRSMSDVAAASGGEFGLGRLRRIERGSLPLDDLVIEAACRLYGADVRAILPSRMAMTIESRVMTVGGVRITVERDDPTSVLSGYLRLIRSIRDQKKAPAIALRRDDIDRLADHLNLDRAQVIERLATLMGATAAQRIAIGSLFAAGAIVVGLVAAGNAAAGGSSASDAPVALVAGVPTVEGTRSVAFAASAERSASTEAPAAAVADQTGLVGVVESSTATSIATPSPPAATSPASIPTTIAGISSAADSGGLVPAASKQSPVLATPETTALPVAADNRSGCSTDPAGAVMSLTVPDIADGCPVRAGGQSLIDAGFVTLVTAAGANAVLATRPGDPGTLWLAAHRTTHGGAFADVPELADGAVITVADDEATATYRVIGRAYVEVRDDRVVDADGNATALATWESIIRSDLGGNLAPRLVLQTCDGANFRWMIYADLVTG